MSHKGPHDDDEKENKGNILKEKEKEKRSHYLKHAEKHQVMDKERRISNPDGSSRSSKEFRHNKVKERDAELKELESHKLVSKKKDTKKNK